MKIYSNKDPKPSTPKAPPLPQPKRRELPPTQPLAKPVPDRPSRPIIRPKK